MSIGDVFSFFNPGKYVPTAQQLSGGLSSQSSTGPSSSVRNATAQDQADAASTPSITKGDGNPLGLPSVNWQTLSTSVGNAQNLVNSLSSNCGNGLATAAASYMGQSAGGLSASVSASLCIDPTTGKATSPVAGAVAGALTGGFVSKTVTSIVGSEATKLLNGINLAPVQKILGTTLGVIKKTKDTFGFLFPTSPDYQDIDLSGRLATPLAKDGSIVYKNGAPRIPTLSHQKVVWTTPATGVKPYTALKKSAAVGSRMSFTLEGRKTVMSLLLNPRHLQISRSQVLSQSASRSGFIVNPTGPGEFEVHIVGTTAGMYELASFGGNKVGGLTPRESYTVAYSNLLFLYNFFLNNGYIFDDEQDNTKSDSEQVRSTQFTPGTSNLPVSRINSMSYVTIEWQKWLWWGFFKTFKIIDSADNPYTLNYEFTFRVCHESDNFKIDNLRASGRPPVTGHVTEGYSSERTLSQKVLTNSDAPSTYQSATSKHKNAIMSNAMFTDDSPTSALNPTVSLTDSAKRLSLGGYTLTSVTGANGGQRFFGQSPDGTAVDLNGLGNQRSLTVVNPGASPVNYLSTSQNSTDSDGNAIVTGTVKVSPGDLPYSYSMSGTTASL